jgi:hypothetical protein
LRTASATAEFGTVGVIAAQDLDRAFHRVGRGLEILDRHLGGRERTGPGDIGIKARHVGQHAQPQRRRVVGPRAETAEAQRQTAGAGQQPAAA